jgi:cell division protein FtsI/penicillin-binding protein 2
MIKNPVPQSASGLRPASAYVVVAAVLTLVALWVGWLAAAGPAFAGFDPQIEEDPRPEYTIVDRSGRPLASFVQRLDLVMSPRAMWQAHTPESMAQRIAAAVPEGPAAASLLERMLPDSKRGVVRARFALSEEQARRLDLFLRSGSCEPAARADTPPAPIEGMWLERSGGGRYALCWQPQVVLSQRVREAHLRRQKDNPLRWSQELADSLATCLAGRPQASGTSDELDPGERELERRRESIWRDLMPSRWCVAMPDFDATSAPALFQLLSDQHVASHQMRIARGRNRRYPLGRSGLLGTWGYVERAEGEIRALEQLGYERTALAKEAARKGLVASLPPNLRDEFAQGVQLELAERHPVSGLERLCDALLAQTQWSFLAREQASYTYFRHRPVRYAPRSYYLDSQSASETPRVVSTLDASLQRRVQVELEQLMQKHRPAVAMAIVLDVQSGEVLALDSREAYPSGGFAPVHHQFTPGSTAKVLIMACALDAGVVDLDERIDVGHDGLFRLPETGRLIHEAEHSKEGLLTPAECLAHSLNAGMSQIGLRVAPELIHARYAAMHYGERPVIGPGPGVGGLGTERGGYLPPLPWSRKNTHTSMCFGHECAVTLWQHAAGLATVVRGGEWTQLSLVKAIEQDGMRYDLPPLPRRRVFDARSCATVRDMMMLGAREGTGAPVASPKLLPGLIVGTKTGTAQKVPTEICLHEELADQARHQREGTSCSSACRRSLVGKRAGHRSCYTSSMCVFGRRAEGGREVLVYVVADEPRGSVRYGSQVAGPTAVAILKEALGETALGQPVTSDAIGGFALSAIQSSDGGDEPWAEDFR